MGLLPLRCLYSLLARINMQTRHVFTFDEQARAGASTSLHARFWTSVALCSRAFVRISCKTFACLGLAACTLNARPGDGLATDGLSQTHQFGSATPQAAGPRGMGDAGGVMRECKNLPLFSQQALPRFLNDCAECHDGSKLKAVLVFDLIDAKSTDPAKLKYTCDAALSDTVKYEDRLQSPLFTEVDPSRIDLEHEFKYESPAAFAAFRDAVMLWLQTE